MTTLFVTDRREIGSVDFGDKTIRLIGSTQNTYTDIAVNSAGEIYASTLDSLYKLSIQGATITESRVLDFSGAVNGLEFAPDGRLFASGGSAIYQIDLASSSTTRTGTISSTSAGDLYVQGKNVVVSTNSLTLVANNQSNGDNSVAFQGIPTNLYGLAKTADSLYGFYNRSIVEFDIQNQKFQSIAFTGDTIRGVFNGATSDGQFQAPSAPARTTEVTGGTGTDTVSRPYSSFDISLVKVDGNTITLQFGAVEKVIMLGVERMGLLNGTLAFDFDGNAGQAYRLYQAAFDRAPDTEGLSYWIRQLDTGRPTLNAVAESFIHSPEFVRTYGTEESVTNARYVDLLYTHTLGRDYDLDGFNYWVDRLNNNQTNRGDLLAFFSESDENVSRTAPDVAEGIWFV